jgi:DNA polymerase-3 subunit beta
MKFSCNQDTFAKYLNIVSRVVSNKPGLPILNNIEFESVKGKLLMTTTDLELSINTWIGADVKTEGRITVPAKQLSEFVNSIPEDTVDVEVAKYNFNISTVNNSASFNTMPADDFPSVPALKDEKPLLKMRGEDFVAAVDRVAFAAATDDIKPVLTGLRLEVDGDTLSLVGTDGLRLSRQICKLEDSADKNVNLLIPVRAFQEVAHIVSNVGEDNEYVELYYLEERNQVLFRVGDVDLVSRLIDGDFPEYRQIIPTGFKTQSDISRADFLNSIKVTNIIARSVLGNKIVLDIDSEGNKYTLSATQTDLGKNESSFDAKVEGDSLKIAFSLKLLSDVLNHISADDLVFECAEPVKPGVFKIKGDDTFIHLVMPMML